MPDEHKDNVVVLLGEGQGEQQEERKIVSQIVIDMYEDGGVYVWGIPKNIQTAMGALHSAMVNVIFHFIQRAQQGKLDAFGTVIED